MQSKEQVSVFRLVTPIALVCVILSSHAMSQGASVDRSITATVDRSVALSAGSDVGALLSRTQSQTAMSVSPRTGSPPSTANGNSSPKTVKAQAGSPIASSSSADTFAVRSSSGGSPIGTHTEGRMPGALGFNSYSLSPGSGGSAMGFTSRAKSLERSPVQVVAVAPGEGSITSTFSMSPGSQRGGLDFPSLVRHSSIHGGNSSAETQKSSARKACRNSSSCIAKPKNRPTKHSNVWNAIQPQPNQK